jgi:hypothetical protein
MARPLFFGALGRSPALLVKALHTVAQRSGSQLSWAAAFLGESAMIDDLLRCCEIDLRGELFEEDRLENCALSNR